MKIAMVFDGLQFGGIERVGIDYARLFSQLGHEVSIFNLQPQLNDMEPEFGKDYKLNHVSMSRWLAPERYAATLKKTWWGKFIYPIAFLLVSAINVVFRPIIRAKNSSFDIAIAFSGHMNDLTFVADSFIKSTHKIAWLHGALYGYAIISPGFLRLYSKIKNLVSLSDSCDAELYSFMQEQHIHKQTIYNPIYITEKEIDENKVSLLKEQYKDFCLMVARLDDDKDQKTAIDAIKILNEKYGFDKKILFVGDGKNREELEKYIQSQNMEQYAFLEGKRADVQNYYSAASVYVHSSPLEGLPTVLLEAMSYHLPIATTDSIPGVREILRNNEFGLISSVYDAEGLADNIYRLYTDPELRKNLTDAADERIKDFSPEAIKGKIENYISSL